jgi:hypothetical protein
MKLEIMKIIKNSIPAAFVLVSGFVAAQNKVVFCSSQPEVKVPSSMQLAIVKKADGSRIVTVMVKAKNKDGKWMPAKNAHLNLYSPAASGVLLIKKELSDGKGKAEVLLPGGLSTDTGRAYVITAKIENDGQYEDAEESIRFKDVNLSLQVNPTDTGRMASATVTIKDASGKDVPVKDYPVHFYVKRLFGLMPALEANTSNTDDNGLATFAYPKDIPGDTAKNMMIVARVEDNDQYGIVEAAAPSRWGTPLIIDKNPFPRALWEPKAPPSLIITLSVIFGGIWSIYLFMFLQLRKIKGDKEEDLALTGN